MLGIIQKAREKHNLHIDQLEVLEAETADVMTGFLPLEKFAQSLAERLKVDRSVADAIAKDINDQLFVKIRESMKKIYEETKPTPVVVSTPAQPPPPATPPLSKPAPPAPPAPPKATQDTTPVPSQPTAPSTSSGQTKPPEVRPADTMLTEKTVSVPSKPPPPASPKPTQDTAQKPPPYKADPYREPPE